MNKLIYQIKVESNKLSEKSDEELTEKIEQLKKELEKESLEKIIVEWFALVQEISFRKIGLKHFETQLLAGLVLHEGNIVEMKTGEGKTLVSTLPVALNALTKKGVHVVTVNDYLAERDQKWMGKIYKGLGLSVGLVKSTSTTIEKQKSYQSDITYVTNSELVFDYLRDSSAYNLNEIVQRPFNFCLIDEIDSVLIDESRTPLILSGFKETENINKLYLAKAIANILEPENDFQLDEKRKDINLTEKGYKETKKRLGKKTLYDPDDPWILDILNALKAKYFFKLNKDYIVLKNKIVIVDEFTGRIMEDRRWSMGLHEAIEIKEKVKVGGGTKTKSSITYQNFFTLYPKLAGMTGTGKTTEKEFQDIYNLNVVVLPTVKPMIRKDLPDLVYQTELAKWKAVLEESKKCFEKGQPILIGTATIEKSEFLSELFKISKIPHQVLNAKPENVTRESEIIAQAGERYAVTIATNMAGRGTDIILGGNPLFKVKEEMWNLLIEKKTQNENFHDFINKIELEYTIREELENDIKNLPLSLDSCKDNFKTFYNYLYKKNKLNWEKENKLLKELGGLFVLGTERHETRRIDNQLRGRAGRQGDPGISQFFVSLEDELIKVFGGDNIKRWVEYLINDKDVPLESDLLTKSLENAQTKVELYNYDLRKNVFQYDDILNSQRKQLFKARNEIIFQNIYEDLFLRFVEISVDDELKKEKKNLNCRFEKLLDGYSFYSQIKNIKKEKLYQEIWISNDLRFAQSNFYELGFLKNTKSIVLLTIIDFYWTEHIERMGYIRETINWRSYGQQNPLIEYNIEAFKSFKIMFEQIRSYMIYYFLNNAINY
jgi:preprotein translocase subunit SecA